MYFSREVRSDFEKLTIFGEIYQDVPVVPNKKKQAC
jgi:hypothetical protein